MRMEPYELTLSAAAAEIQAGRLSPVELTNSVLDRIDAIENTLHAFSCVTAELARNAAQAAAEEIAAGRYRGPLHGIPLSVKDLYDTAGVLSTSGSKLRAGHIPDTDAVTVERLFAAGMVMVGKTHTHEFAYGVITPISRNPWNPRHIVGGSSGGAAAAVASGACMIGLGSDTAGSIRIPASLCGTVGLKPTYGRVSRRGVASLAWSLDHVGPLTRNVRDCALVLNAIAGFDRLDPACVDVPVPDYTTGLDQDITGLRIGVPANYFFDHVHDDVATAVRHAIGVLQNLGAQVREVTIPYADALAAVDGDFIMTAEEVQPVLRALRHAGIHIVALHNHMVGEQPAFYFTHYWGLGPAKDLASGVRVALDAQKNTGADRGAGAGYLHGFIANARAESGTDRGGDQSHAPPQ